MLSCMQFAAVVSVPLLAFLADSIGKPRTVVIALSTVRPSRLAALSRAPLS